MSVEKELWFHVNDKTSPQTLAAVFNSQYSTLFIEPGRQHVLDGLPIPQRMKLAVGIRDKHDLETLENNPALAAKTTTVVSRDATLVEEIRAKTKFKTGVFIEVNDRQSLDACVATSRKTDLLLIDFKDPTNIPLELILATTQPLDTRVLKKVSRADDGEVSFLTMESGSDGIVLSTDDAGEIVKLGQAFERSGQGSFALKDATVTSIAHTGMGDRACVDTTSELFQDEGMIIGSTSSGGLMICSETHFLPYMNLRPFRVNAGALHSYIWGPDNFVPYLCDLRAGDRVYAVNSRGVGRVVTVGRVKIERRPLLKIEAEIDGARVNTFIQDDWHVRVFGAKGEIRPSSEVRVGDKLLGFADKPGRHVGIKISESIKEA